MENKRCLGAGKEKIAADFLREQGYTILDKNFFCHGGEIDIIASEGDYLVFVEVKYRKNTRYGYPEEAVTAVKMKRIIKAARYYMYKNHYNENIPCRFDVVGILDDEIRLTRNAFSYI